MTPAQKIDTSLLKIAEFTLRLGNPAAMAGVGAEWTEGVDYKSLPKTAGMNTSDKVQTALIKLAYGGNDLGFSWERTPMVYSGAFDYGMLPRGRKTITPEQTAAVLNRAAEIAKQRKLDTRITGRYTTEFEGNLAKELAKEKGIDLNSPSVESDGIPVGMWAEMIQSALAKKKLKNFDESLDTEELMPIFYTTTHPLKEGVKPKKGLLGGNKNTEGDYDYGVNPMNLAFDEFYKSNPRLGYPR